MKNIVEKINESRSPKGPREYNDGHVYQFLYDLAKSLYNFPETTKDHLTEDVLTDMILGFGKLYNITKDEVIYCYLLLDSKWDELLIVGNDKDTENYGEEIKIMTNFVKRNKKTIKEFVKLYLDKFRNEKYLS